MKNTILALTLCAMLATALVGCGERKENFPGTATVTDRRYSQSYTVTDDINADSGAYNGSFGNAGSAANPSASTGKKVTGKAGRYRRNSTTTWEQMVENGRIHDRDGYLLDGENTTW